MEGLEPGSPVHVAGYGPRVDWSTLLASAGVSAVVGAVVSLLTVSQATVRRARAERREAARRAVSAAVSPVLDEVARYEYLRPPEPKRTLEQSHMDDHARLVIVRRAAADLPAWRRWLIDRRCRRVFGHYWTDLARDYPSALDSDSGSLTSWLAASTRDYRASAGRGPVDGLLHRAYCERAGHPLVHKLRRELRRLAAAW